MENFNFSDCRKAVNQATFRPTAERKAAAAKLLKEALDFVTNLEEVADKPSKKAGKKRRRKTTKRTPSQKVADHMDRASMKTNEVGPIKPSKKAKKASVEEARKSAKAVSEASGAAAKAAKKAALRAEAEAKPTASKKRLKVNVCPLWRTRLRLSPQCSPCTWSLRLSLLLPTKLGWMASPSNRLVSLTTHSLHL